MNSANNNRGQQQHQLQHQPNYMYSSGPNSSLSPYPYNNNNNNNNNMQQRSNNNNNNNNSSSMLNPQFYPSPHNSMLVSPSKLSDTSMSNMHHHQMQTQTQPHINDTTVLSPLQVSPHLKQQKPNGSQFIPHSPVTSSPSQIFSNSNSPQTPHPQSAHFSYMRQHQQHQQQQQQSHINNNNMPVQQQQHMIHSQNQLQSSPTLGSSSSHNYQSSNNSSLNSSIDANLSNMNDKSSIHHNMFNQQQQYQPQNFQGILIALSHAYLLFEHFL